MKIVLTILILFVAVTIQQGPLDSAEVIALNNLNNILLQNWVLTPVESICELNFNITCHTNKKNINSIRFTHPSNLATINLPDDIFAFTLIDNIWINSYRINTPTSFWSKLHFFTAITLLTFYRVTDPIQGIVYIPPTINEFNIHQIYTPVPVELFTLSNFEFLTLGLENTYEVANTYPSDLPSNSNIQRLTVSTFGGFDLIGTKMANCTDLYIVFNGNFAYTYNLYDTWPKVESLIVDNSRFNPVSLQTFPSTILKVPNLKTLSVYSEEKFTITVDSLPFNFTSTRLERLNFHDFDFTQLDSQGLILNTLKCGISFSSCDVDFAKLNLLQFKYVDLDGPSTIIGSLPTGSYKNMETFGTYTNYAGVVPPSMCEIQKYISISNSQITSLPDCFVCNWGATDSYASTFNNDVSLPVYTQTCNSLSLTEYSTNPVATLKGAITLTGVNLGWVVYNENNVAYPPQYPMIGNSKVVLTVPEGTGINKNIQVKFHANANPISTPTTIPISYLPPTISSLENPLQSSQLTIVGDNFGPDTTLTSVTIAGNSFTTFQLSSYPHTQILLSPNFQYKQETISVGVTVDGQSGYKVIRAGTPSLNQPLQPIYTGGGGFELLGEFLSFDTTIMNCTLDGKTLNLYSGSKDSVIFEFDPIPIGTYTLVFNLDDYHLSTNIEVNNDKPCKVYHGRCYGKKPVCDSPFVGQYCASLPSNISQPLPVSTTLTDSTPSSPVTISYNGVESTVSYFIGLTSILEVNTDNEVVKTNSIVASAFQSNTTVPEYSTYSYTLADYCTSIITWVAVDQNMNSLSGLPIKVLKSTLRYQFYCMLYPFLSTDNSLEIRHKVEFEVLSTNVTEYCHETVTDDGNNFSQAKLNYLDFYTRFQQPCIGYGGCTVEPQTITLENNFISMDIIAKFASASPNIIGYEMDFNLLIDENGCYNISTTGVSTSSNGDTSTTTSTTGSGTNTNNCKGRPMCYGHGQCINRRCKCDNGWDGEMCDSVDTKLPPIDDPNTTSPEVDYEKDGLGLHISIYEIRELNFKDSLVKKQTFLPKWNYTTTKTSDIETFVYNYLLFTDTTVQVNVDYFFTKQEIEFAGESAIKKPGSIKYSANITSWPFQSLSNKLQVIFMANVKDLSESSDTCIYKSVQYSSDNNVETISIQVNDRTFSADFIDMAILDGKPTKIGNTIIPPTTKDTNIQGTFLVGVNTPAHRDYITIDPDFRLLISYVPAEDKEGSICQDTSKKSKLSGAKIAGIVIGVVVFVAAVVAVVVYNIKFTKDKIKLQNTLLRRLGEANK